ncbi:MAG: hypothetical protein HY293_04180 [Planctomycetes bacterium]|nr:hypothetical protein [Planctomycetota bacterium]
MAGLDLSWRPDPILELRALGAGAVERAHQNFFKVDAEALLRLSDSVGVSLGYRLHALRFRQSANQSNLKFHGPSLGLEISF